MVQGLVLALDGVHLLLEAHRNLSGWHGLFLVPVSMYFVPVLYAALNFGVEGALPTALLCVALSIPNIVLFHHGDERFGVMVQLVLVVVLGVMVAARVDREQRAKEVAERANLDLRAAHEAMREYVQLAMRAQEDERQRLSRELHDETIQELVVARNALHDSPSHRDAQVRTTEAVLDRTIDGIRRMCRALRPSILDDLGLVPALDVLVNEVQARSDLNITMVVEGDIYRLPEDAELAVFRVAQEALRNVERHARATHARVHLQYATNGLSLQVEDDGHGFDPSTVPHGGLGLAGMRQRARLVQADLHITSTGHRTIVRLDLPSDGRIHSSAHSHF